MRVLYSTVQGYRARYWYIFLIRAYVTYPANDDPANDGRVYIVSSILVPRSPVVKLFTKVKQSWSRPLCTCKIEYKCTGW